MHTQFKILEEDIDENYEPTREEIIEYATYLGMSPRSDSKYFHIAREGLKTPLPIPWKPVELRNGEIFYFNPQTQVLQEQHPLDDHFKRKYIEEKKKDSQQPSKTSKKLKGLCEKLRDTDETTQKTEKKQSQRAEISADISSGLNESTYFKEQTDVLDNKFKFELMQYEREQESFLEIYKMSQARQVEQEQSGEQDSFEDINQSKNTTNIPEKAIKIRQEYLNKKEELKQQLQQEYDRKIITEKESLNQKSVIQNKEYIAAKEQKNSERLEQLKKDYENKIANKLKTNKELEKDLKQKKLQHEQVYSQKEKELLIKWQTVQKKYKLELEKEFSQILQKLEQQQTQQQNEISNTIRLQKAQNSKQLYDFYNGDSEFQIKKRWRDIYKEKIELSRISQAQEMEDELKNEEIALYEQMTDNVIKYKNLIRQNLVRMKQQQIDNERLYYNNFYKEQLQNYKHDCSKKVELQIQKLELNQIVVSNESFTKLDKSQSKVFNPDLRIQKKDLELQIQEYKSKIDDYKKQIYLIKTMKEESQFINQVMNQEDRIDFLQQSLREKDNILNELTKQIIQQPYIAEQSVNTTKNIKSDQWSQQIEQERQWLNLQKERLKYDKKQLKKYYEKLTLLTSTNEEVNQYNKSVNTVRNNQQIIKNCEYIINKLLDNLKQYYQTKIIKYLHENDTLLEDLQSQKLLLESVLQMPIESNLLYKSYRIGSASLHQNELNTSQLQSFTNNQKQLLRDMKDYLNKSMQSRLC